MEGTRRPALVELVERYQQDPNRWACALCERLYTLLHRVIPKTVALPEEPEALAHFVIMKLVSVDCATIDSMEAYVVRALQNRMRDLLRSEARRESHLDRLRQVVDGSPGPRSEGLRVDARMELQRLHAYFEAPAPLDRRCEGDGRAAPHMPEAQHARWRTIFHVAREILGAGGSVAGASREASVRLGMPVSAYEFRRDLKTLLRRATTWKP